MTNFDTLAVANRFQVTIDGTLDLGLWSSVSGLDVTWGLCEYRAGDAGNARWFYPGSTKYSDIQLTRAACADTMKVQQWLSTISISQNGSTSSRSSGTINLLSADLSQQPVASWSLKNVMALKWAIEKFDASQSKVALETLTLAHEGFLNDETATGTSSL
jgi:phage tail-like protein